MSNGRSAAYNLGYYIGFNNTCEDCIYHPDSDEFKDWEKGYDDGMYHTEEGEQDYD